MSKTEAASLTPSLFLSYPGFDGTGALSYDYKYKINTKLVLFILKPYLPGSTTAPRTRNFEHSSIFTELLVRESLGFSDLHDGEVI